MRYRDRSFIERTAGFSLLALLLVFSGCSTYENVTGYFNTYYNASKLYSDALDEIEKTPATQNDSNYFARPVIPKSAADKLEKVIEKCSKLIQFYPKSTWVDNALFMIGNSYLLSGESESALRKFAELTQNFPESDFRYDARFLSAEADYHMKKEDAALSLIKELVPEITAEGKNDILLKAVVLEAQISFDRMDYRQAAESYERAVGIGGERKLRAFAQYQLGLCYERLGDVPKAADAYGKVREYHPDFAMELRARLKEGMMLSMSGKQDKALDALENLKAEPLKPEQRALVELEIANTTWRMGDTARASRLYEYIDTTYRRTEASAKSYYQQAVIRETKYFDFSGARTFYDKAKGEYMGADISPRAQQKAQALTDYFTHVGELIRYDSLLSVALEEDSLTSADSTSHGRGDSLLALSDSTHPRVAALPAPGLDSTRSAKDSLKTAALVLDTALAKMKPPEAPTERLQAPPEGQMEPSPLQARPGSLAPDTLLASSRMQKGKDTLMAGRLDTLKGKSPPPPAVKTAGLVQDTAIAKMKPREAPTERPQAPPEGQMEPSLLQARRGTVAPDTLLASSRMHRGKDTLMGGRLDTLKGKSPPPPKPPVKLSSDSLRILIAKTEFELAGFFFLQMNIPDSALAWYGALVDECPESPLVPRAIYTMAEIYRTMSDTLTVDSLYDMILDEYPESEYAQQVRRLRGIEVHNAANDSADMAYSRAESLLVSGKTEEALAGFKDLASLYPASPMAPKALYSIGWIFETLRVENDSAAAWYKTLIKQYPSSIYAQDAQPRVAVKDDPKSLSQYVKIKEIPGLGKTAAPGKGKGLLKPGQQDQQDQQDEDIQGGKRRDENTDQEEDQQDDETPTDEDDSGGD